MGWGSHCPDCGKADCRWVHGPVCDGSLPVFLKKHAELEARLMAFSGALEEIANSDDIDNALDPARNKRVAIAVLSAGQP